MERDEIYKIYDSIWQNINREDTLVGNRLTWTLASSAAIGVILAALIPILELNNLSNITPIKIIVGAIITFLLYYAYYMASQTYKGIEAAYSQIEKLKKHYKGLNEDYFTPKKLPVPFGDNKEHIDGVNSATKIVESIRTIWLILFLISLFYLGFLLFSWFCLLGKEIFFFPINQINSISP